MTTKWKPEKYQNEYRETMQKWLDQQTAKLKKSGKRVSKTMYKGNDSVVDFISLLKDSMKKGTPTAAKTAAKKKRAPE